MSLSTGPTLELAAAAKIMTLVMMMMMMMMEERKGEVVSNQVSDSRWAILSGQYYLRLYLLPGRPARVHLYDRTCVGRSQPLSLLLSAQPSPAGTPIRLHSNIIPLSTR